MDSKFNSERRCSGEPESDSNPQVFIVDPRKPLSLKTFFGPKMFLEVIWRSLLWGSLISPLVTFVFSGGLQNPLAVWQSWVEGGRLLLWVIPAIGIVWAFFLSSFGILLRYSMIPLLERWRPRFPTAISVSIFGFLFGFTALCCIFLVTFYGLGVRVFVTGKALTEAGVAGLIAVGIAQILYSHFLNEVRLWETWKREQELARHKLEGELMNLNMRMRPHFFFNSINTLAALIDQDKNQAQEFLANLSDLFRMSFTHGQKTSWCTWIDEKRLVESYLNIERSRFGDRLLYSFEVDFPDFIQFPAFLLQPLVENAVKYGLASTQDEVYVVLRGEVIDEKWSIQIRNPVCDGTIISLEEGHSLFNVHERLKLLGGNLEFEIEKGSATIRLEAPVTDH